MLTILSWATAICLGLASSTCPDHVSCLSSSSVCCANDGLTPSGFHCCKTDNVCTPSGCSALKGCPDARDYDERCLVEQICCMTNDSHERNVKFLCCDKDTEDIVWCDEHTFCPSSKYCAPSKVSYSRWQCKTRIFT